MHELDRHGDPELGKTLCRFISFVITCLVACERLVPAGASTGPRSCTAGLPQPPLPCDALVNAADMVPNTGLLDEVQVAETYAIGDCAEPFNIALAIRGGNDAGRAL